MVKAKIRKSRVKQPSEADDEDLRMKVNCCAPTGERVLWLVLSSEISFYLGFDCQLPEVPVSPLNSVQLRCSLPCQLAGLVHQRCFERLQTQGITALGNAKGRAREWSSREKEKV